ETAMKVTLRILAIGLMITLLPSLGLAQTDRSEMNDWLKATQNQGEIPVGTTITMANWQQYKQFMPLGMIKLYQGVYGWKMPADVQMNVGAAEYGNIPRTWVDATEKYGSQTQVEFLPNGHYQIKNYYGGTPFPNPQDPYKGWKILANVFWFARPALYVNSPENYGTVWAVDRYGDIGPSTFDVVYRQTAYITDPGFPHEETYAPGTWQTQWGMQESPEQARYTASLSMFYKDQEKNPYPDTFVFVPALRRSLRLSASSRCSPVFGLDWSYDDANGNGFNGSTSVYTGDFLGDRKIITMTKFSQDGADFPSGYDMPLAFPKPSWGKWSVRPMAIDDVHRIPSEAPGYCYSSRVMYIDKEFWDGMWVDLYDSNRKLWKTISYLDDFGDIPQLGHSLDGVSSVAWDLQNTHMTVWCGYANPGKHKPFINFQAPKEYFNGVKYGTPSGLMQILR
ncbi:MAG TPA: DUF1329 domain-containing protein, partial [Candidatus Binataceae bacterium]|nr:DUF1329 domain-containing protein [Candidatus Binataceae bacterium]